MGLLSIVSLVVNEDVGTYILDLMKIHLQALQTTVNEFRDQVMELPSALSY